MTHKNSIYFALTIMFLLLITSCIDLNENSKSDPKAKRFISNFHISTYSYYDETKASSMDSTGNLIVRHPEDYICLEGHKDLEIDSLTSNTNLIFLRNAYPTLVDTMYFGEPAPNWCAKIGTVKGSIELYLKPKYIYTDSTFKIKLIQEPNHYFMWQSSLDPFVKGINATTQFRYTIDNSIPQDWTIRPAEWRHKIGIDFIEDYKLICDGFEKFTKLDSIVINGTSNQVYFSPTHLIDDESCTIITGYRYLNPFTGQATDSVRNEEITFEVMNPKYGGDMYSYNFIYGKHYFSFNKDWVPLFDGARHHKGIRFLDKNGNIIWNDFEFNLFQYSVEFKILEIPENATAIEIYLFPFIYFSHEQYYLFLDKSKNDSLLIEKHIKQTNGVYGMNRFDLKTVEDPLPEF